MTSNATYAVSSDLTGEAYAEVAAIWDDLERRYGLRAAREAVHPHVTYVVGDCLYPGRLTGALACVTSRIQPYEIGLDGVGVFAGEAPVVFLRVAMCSALRYAYSLVLEAAQGAGMTVWPYYLPDAWIPHVTLAMRDLAPDLLASVLADIEARPTRFVTSLRSIELVHVTSPRHCYLVHFRLGHNG